MKKIKRVLSILLVCCLVVCSIPLSTASAWTPFSDVSPNAWYTPAVEYVYETGLFSGTSDTTFSPHAPMTRGMIVTVLYRAEGCPAASAPHFTDVPSGKYYSDSVGWAAENEIIVGYESGCFKPNDSITREALVTILHRYAGHPNTSGNLSNFVDSNEVSGWAYAPMCWAVENSIVSGKGNGILDPCGTATRAEVAQLLKNYMNQESDEELSVDTLQQYFEVTNSIEDVAENYLDSNGYVDRSDIDDLSDAVVSQINLCMNQGTILDYSVEDSCIWMQLESGIQYVYLFPIEGMDGYGTETRMTVITYQPFNQWYYTERPGTNQGHNGELATDDVAIRLNIQFSNFYFNQDYDDQEVTLDSIREWSDNQIILWHGHGGFDAHNHSYLGIGEQLNEQEFLWNPIYYVQNLEYTDDYLSGRIICTSMEDRLAVGSKFFEKYVSSMNNSFVYLAACESAKDDVLADTLLNKGVVAVVGSSDSILTDYNQAMEREICTRMMDANPSTGRYYTLKESLDYAKMVHGQDDGGGTEVLILGGSEAENYRFSDTVVSVESSSALSGMVCQASDRVTPISGAEIAVYQNDSLCTTVSSDSTGKYTINLPTGDYQIKISAPGYISFNCNATVEENQTNYMETFLMAQGTPGSSGIVCGKIINAYTGDGIDGAKLTIRSGWNYISGSSISGTTTSESDGSYSYTLPIGNYTVYVEKAGFVSTHFNIVVQEGTTSSQNGAITPIVSGNNFRAVLTWGENPRDLDSHMEGYNSNGSSFHVYYSYKSASESGTRFCTLDVDETGGYGPETITLNATTDRPYYYYIKKYAGSGSLSTSGAQVKLYQGDTLVATFNVPTDQGTGDCWNVFSIKDGKLITHNTITSSPDKSYAD